MPAMPTCTNTRTPRDMDRAHVLHPYTDFSSFAQTGSQIIAEPILGAGGVLVAPQGYHARMRAVCDEYGLLYIADEVVTAFGRLGEWFASSAIFDRQPDIIDCAKGISSGYIPLRATLLLGQIYEVISDPQCQGGVFSMGLTYSGHPVAFAAALINIQIIERGAVGQCISHGRVSATGRQGTAKSGYCRRCA